MILSNFVLLSSYKAISYAYVVKQSSLCTRIHQIQENPRCIEHNSPGREDDIKKEELVDINMAFLKNLDRDSVKTHLNSHILMRHVQSILCI